MDTYVGTISKTIEEKFTMSHLLPKSLGESFLHAIKIDIHWLGLIQNSDDSIINKLDKIVQKFDLWTDTYLSSEFGSKLTDEHILCEKLQNLVDSIRLFILKTYLPLSFYDEIKVSAVKSFYNNHRKESLGKLITTLKLLIFKKKYLTSQKIQWDTLIGNFTYCFYKTTGVELSINIFPELKVQLGVADSIASFQIDMLFESIWCSINSLKMFLLKNMRYRQIESAISSINQDSFKKSDEILPPGIIVTTKSPFSRLRKKHLIIESSGLKNPKRAPDFIVTIGIEDLPYFNNDIKLINTGSQIDIYALLLIKPNALYLVEITLYDEVYIKLDEDQELVLKNGMHLIFSEDVKEVRCMVGIKQNGIQFFNFINDWDDIEVNFDEGESERLITIHEESNNAIIIKSQNKFKLKTISNYSIFYSLKSLDEEAGRARLAELRFNTTFRVRETEFKYEPL